jgi:hypothetical protein
MEFEIMVRTGNSDYTMKVEQLNVTKVSEQYRISNQSGTKCIIIQSNRPFFRNKGLKKRKPNYELKEGKVLYKKYLDEAFIKIMQVIEPHNYPTPKPSIEAPVIGPPSRRKSKEESNNHWGDSVAKLKERERNLGDSE